MWGVEHSIMAVVAGCFALWFTITKNWLWLGAVALSQVPFWVGFLAYSLTGDNAPININLAFNLIVASSFFRWADRLQKNGLGGIVQVRICLIFLLGAAIDVTAIIYPSDYYIGMQEGVHYLALITIGGRAYVVRHDGLWRYSRNRANPKEGGGLV